MSSAMSGYLNAGEFTPANLQHREQPRVPAQPRRTESKRGVSVGNAVSSGRRMLSRRELPKNSYKLKPYSDVDSGVDGDVPKYLNVKKVSRKAMHTLFSIVNNANIKQYKLANFYKYKPDEKKITRGNDETEATHYGVDHTIAVHILQYIHGDYKECSDKIFGKVEDIYKRYMTDYKSSRATNLYPKELSDDTLFMIGVSYLRTRYYSILVDSLTRYKNHIEATDSQHKKRDPSFKHIKPILRRTCRSANNQNWFIALSAYITEKTSTQGELATFIKNSKIGKMHADCVTAYKAHRNQTQDPTDTKIKITKTRKALYKILRRYIRRTLLPKSLVKYEDLRKIPTQLVADYGACFGKDGATQRERNRLIVKRFILRRFIDDRMEHKDILVLIRIAFAIWSKKMEQWQIDNPK